MRRHTQIRRWTTPALAALTMLGCAWLRAENALVALDRVVAVVNNQAILSSDVNNEMRLAVLEPRAADEGPPTPRNALQDLIGRALIRQQIRQEDAQAAHPSPQKVNARVIELRRELPACARLDCAGDAGWRKFLQLHGLTEAQVKDYVQMRMEILAFIEDRFRPGIRIPREDVEKYYRQTLVPQYAKGASIPTLDQVAPRIEEILLQQQVDLLFDAWLDNLRKQGDVEILDPALESAGSTVVNGADR